MYCQKFAEIVQLSRLHQASRRIMVPDKYRPANRDAIDGAERESNPVPLAGISQPVSSWPRSARQAMVGFQAIVPFVKVRSAFLDGNSLRPSRTGRS
jgi:hypothetical protein